MKNFLYYFFFNAGLQRIIFSYKIYFFLVGILLGIDFLVNAFYFLYSTLKMFPLCLPIFICPIYCSFHDVSCFFSYFFIFGFQKFACEASSHDSFCICPAWGLVVFLNLLIIFFTKFEMFSAIILSNIFCVLFSFFAVSEISFQHISPLVWVQKFVCESLFTCFFPLQSSKYIISFIYVQVQYLFTQSSSFY